MLRKTPLLAQSVALSMLILALVFLSLVASARMERPGAYLDDGQLAPQPQAAATRAKIPRTSLTINGIVDALVTPAAITMAFSNDGDTWLEVNNLLGSTQTITVETPGNVGGLEIEDLTVPVPPTTRYKIGPFLANVFQRRFAPDKNFVYVTLPATTNLTIGAFTVGGGQ